MSWRQIPKVQRKWKVAVVREKWQNGRRELCQLCKSTLHIRSWRLFKGMLWKHGQKIGTALFLLLLVQVFPLLWICFVKKSKLEIPLFISSSFLWILHVEQDLSGHMNFLFPFASSVFKLDFRMRVVLLSYLWITFWSAEQFSFLVLLLVMILSTCR